MTVNPFPVTIMVPFNPDLGAFSLGQTAIEAHAAGHEQSKTSADNKVLHLQLLTVF
jgi:hypothetical protein